MPPVQICQLKLTSILYQNGTPLQDKTVQDKQSVYTFLRYLMLFLFLGACGSYPPAKIHFERPNKPPHSESEDVYQKKSKVAPEKPRRRSKDQGIPDRPEPYSSQRSHRKITDETGEVDARLSPLSNSEDDTREYRLPFDCIDVKNQRKLRGENGNFSTDSWEAKTVKSSASDHCLSGSFRRGNMLYQSDRTIERGGISRGRGSIYSDVTGGSYYENLRSTSDERDDFLESYDKLLEIHQDTVRQIAEATVFKCNCKDLKDTDWNDFEIRGKMLNYGISSYVTIPVSVKRDGKKSDEKYTAWVSEPLFAPYSIFCFIFDHFPFQIQLFWTFKQ